MALGPFARLLIWLLNRCPSVSSIDLSSPTTQDSTPTASALDPDALSQDLKDPNYRQAYIQFLEACHNMPARRFRP